ncbi:MAG: hypothetical protein ACREAK_02990 [Nitrosarchaeum sp.]
MSVIIKTYTITFVSKEDKTKAFGFLLKSNFPFKGVGINTITVQKDAYDALLERNIQFK